MGFAISGKLTDVEHQYVGENYLLTTIEVDINGRPLRFTSKGALAERTLALLNDAPPGSSVYAQGDIEYRTNNQRTFLELVANDVLLMGAIGNAAATFKTQGFVKGTGERSKRDGSSSFGFAIMQPLVFGREGLMPEAELELSMSDENLTTWRQSAGKWVTVGGTISGYKTENDKGVRVWPRFQVSSSMHIIDTPSWLADYRIGEVAASPFEI
jgi:hypothetical protein